MYSARIELGWVDKWFDGETADEIMKKVEEYQDFDCLISMAWSREKKQAEVKKLDEFIRKYNRGELTMEDLKNLDVKLSIANIKCHEIKEI